MFICFSQTNSLNRNSQAFLLWLCGMSLKKIYPTFKKAAGGADREINSNEGRSTSWVDEFYYFPPASAAAADECGDRGEDKTQSQTYTRALSISKHWYTLHCDEYLNNAFAHHSGFTYRTAQNLKKFRQVFILSRNCAACGYIQY